jgi:hypothetical protein
VHKFHVQPEICLICFIPVKLVRNSSVLPINLSPACLFFVSSHMADSSGTMDWVEFKNWSFRL